jgi:hypothetical protein
MAKMEGRRWTLDDAWWTEAPPVLGSARGARGEEDGAATETETLWADDAEAWSDEPQTSPEIDVAALVAAVSGQPIAPRSDAADSGAGEIDPLWAYF